MFPFVVSAPLSWQIVRKIDQSKGKKKADGDSTFWTKVFSIVQVFIFSCVWVWIAISTAFTFVALCPREGELWYFVVRLFIWTSWCYVVNIAAAIAEFNPYAVTVLGWVASLTILLSLTGNWAGFPAGVIRTLGQGDMPVALVLSADGCEQLNRAAGGKPVCRVAPMEKMALVCPVILRSRMGSPFFIQVSVYDLHGHWPEAYSPPRLSAIYRPEGSSRVEPPGSDASCPRDRNTFIRRSRDLSG